MKVRFDRKPDDYRANVRMPKELGLYLTELAHQNGNTVTFEICDMIKRSMSEHPEIMEIVKRRMENEQ